jgi:uncharacterized protein YjbJ (UPF0337 family)
MIESIAIALEGDRSCFSFGKFHQFHKEQIMSLKDRAEATAKNIEGKVQEAVGDLTGDPKDQAEGKAKQAEAKVRHTVEDIKDEAKKVID